MSRRVRISSAAVLLALVAACSSAGRGSARKTAGGKPPTASQTARSSVSPAPSKVGGPGTYVAGGPQDNSGETFTATVFAPTSDLTVAKVENFRTRVGAPRISYITVKQDNMHGTREGGSTGVSIVTNDGQTVEYAPAWQWVGDEQDKVTNDDTLYNEAVDLYNSMLNQDTVLPEAVKTALYTSETTPASVKTVYVTAGLGDQIPMRKVS